VVVPPILSKECGMMNPTKLKIHKTKRLFSFRIRVIFALRPFHDVPLRNKECEMKRMVVCPQCGKGFEPGVNGVVAVRLGCDECLELARDADGYPWRPGQMVMDRFVKGELTAVSREVAFAGVG
jgi:hypothetical protein